MNLSTKVAVLSVVVGIGVVATVVATSAQRQQQPPARGRVFFIEPKDGATVKSPVRLKFGVENFQIAAVPPGTVEASRNGVGHYHVGIDTECLPAGAVIPKAAPWVHFGDGKDLIEMQLTVGRHKIALEIGDDLHQTLAGLCTTITLNVAP